MLVDTVISDDRQSPKGLDDSRHRCVTHFGYRGKRDTDAPPGDVGITSKKGQE